MILGVLGGSSQDLDTWLITMVSFSPLSKEHPDIFFQPTLGLGRIRDVKPTKTWNSLVRRRTPPSVREHTLILLKSKISNIPEGIEDDRI